MDKQLELEGLGSFFIDRMPRETSTLELVDIMPWYLCTKKLYLDAPDTLIKVVTHRGIDYNTELSPAVWKKRNAEGKYDTFMAFPNRREEFVMNALRYMACQKRIGVKTTEEKLVSITFSLHDLRKELQKVKRSYNWVHLEESLQILSRTSLQVTCFDLVLSGTLLSGLRGKINGNNSHFTATFHPVISQAIICDSHYSIDYYDLQTLKSRVSRWLYTRFVHEIRNAELVTLLNPSKARGLSFSYEEVMNLSGLAHKSAKKHDLVEIRNAIKELVKADLIQEEDKENYPHEIEKGNKWTIYPSQRLKDIIMNGHGTGRAKDKLILESSIVDSN